MKICPIAYTVNLTESKGVKKSVESLWERSVNLQVIKSGDSIAQNVVVSDSTFGSILPKIRNLAIACICYVSANIKALETLGYTEHTCNYVVILDSWFSGKVSVVGTPPNFGLFSLDITGFLML